MLVRCLYASLATAPISEEMVRSILDQSRRNNLPRGITGVLCFVNRTFIQVLEGGRDEVSTLLVRLVSDTRHSAVRILQFEEVPERTFSNWTMGHIDVSKANQGLVLRHSTSSEIDPFSNPAAATMALVSALVAHGCISRI